MPGESQISGPPFSKSKPPVTPLPLPPINSLNSVQTGSSSNKNFNVITKAATVDYIHCDRTDDKLPNKRSVQFNVKGEVTGTGRDKDSNKRNHDAKWGWDEDEIHRKLQTSLKKNKEKEHYKIQRGMSERSIKDHLSKLSTHELKWLDTHELKEVKTIKDLHIGIKNLNICCKDKTGTLLDFCFIMGFVQIGLAVVAAVGKLMSIFSFLQSARLALHTSLVFGSKQISLNLHIAEGISYLLLLLSGICIIIGVNFRKKWVVLTYIFTCVITGILLILIILFQLAFDDSEHNRTYRGPLWITASTVLLLTDIILTMYAFNLFFAFDDFMLGMHDLENDDALIHDRLSVVRIRTFNINIPEPGTSDYLIHREHPHLRFVSFNSDTSITDKVVPSNNPPAGHLKSLPETAKQKNEKKRKEEKDKDKQPVKGKKFKAFVTRVDTEDTEEEKGKDNEKGKEKGKGKVNKDSKKEKKKYKEKGKEVQKQKFRELIARLDQEPIDEEEKDQENEDELKKLVENLLHDKYDFRHVDHHEKVDKHDHHRA